MNVNDSHTFGPLFGVTAAAFGVFDFQNVPVRTTNAAVHDQHLFGPSLITEVLLGVQRWASHLAADGPYPLPASQDLRWFPVVGDEEFRTLPVTRLVGT